MYKTSLLTAACAALLLSSGAFFAPGYAASNTGFMQACSTQWQGMKSAGTVPAGMKWSDFLKNCNGGAATQVSTPIKPTPAPAATPISYKAPQTSAAVTPTQVSTGQTFMQACSAQWQSMKAAGTIPAGMKWTGFLKTCSANPNTVQASTSPAQTSPQPVTPTQTQTATYAPAKKVVSAARASGNATPGQLAERARIKECGSEWQAAKASNNIPTGQTWPQYWSACNVRLKTDPAYQG